MTFFFEPRKGGRPFIEDQALVFLKNTHGTTMPPGGVGRVTGMTSQGNVHIWEVTRPDGTAANFYVVNGPAAIASGGVGAGHAGPIVTAAYDIADGTPSGEWGPQSGSWLLRSAGTGFNVVGVRNLSQGDLVDAIQAAQAGTGVEQDWGQLTQVADQSLTGDSTYRKVLADGASDSGGILSADLSTDDITCSEAAPTLELAVHVWLKHTDVGASATFGVVGFAQFAIRRNGILQNPTFDRISVLGSSTVFVEQQFNVTQISDFGTASANDAYELWCQNTVDIDLLYVTFTLKEVKDLV